jgi:hypothetical protein
MPNNFSTTDSFHITSNSLFASPPPPLKVVYDERRTAQVHKPQICNSFRASRVTSAEDGRLILSAHIYSTDQRLQLIHAHRRFPLLCSSITKFSCFFHFPICPFTIPATMMPTAFIIFSSESRGLWQTCRTVSHYRLPPVRTVVNCHRGVFPREKVSRK